MERLKKAATCESEGIEVYICKTCKKSKEETIAPTGHTKTEIRDKKVATCKEEGYTGDTYCVTCGKKLAVGKMIAKTDHDWTITEIPATCEQDGVRTYTCDICHTTKERTDQRHRTQLRGMDHNKKKQRYLPKQNRSVPAARVVKKRSRPMEKS